MKRIVVLATTVVAMLLLVSCSSDAHKGEHCVRSHTERLPITTYIMVGKVMLPITNYVDYTVCDEWKPDVPR